MIRSNQRPGPSIRLAILACTLNLASLITGCSGPDPAGPGDVGVAGKSSMERQVPPVTHATAATQVCVLLQDDGGPDPLATAKAIASDYALVIVESFGAGALVLFEGSPDLVALADDPRVRASQGNEFTVLGRPVEVVMGFFEGDWEDIGLPQQEALAPLHLDRLHSRLQGRGMRVAVLDTGVDSSHGLLAGRVELIPPGSSVLSSEEVAMGVDSDGDGEFDEAYGHGTHVAGIIATIAPRATILPIRVLDSDGVGDAFTLAMGLYTAQAMGAHVVNLSLILSDETTVIETVLRDLETSGLVVVGAAGNQPGDARFPAADSHVVGVGATNSSGTIASFSATGNLRFFAPGVGIESAYPGDRVAWASGTSMASAVTSGCIALLGQRVRNMEHLIEVLRSTAGETVDGDGRLLDPLAAFHRIRTVSRVPPTRTRG